MTILPGTLTAPLALADLVGPFVATSAAMAWAASVRAISALRSSKLCWPAMTSPIR